MRYESYIEIPDGYVPVHTERILTPDEARFIVSRRRFGTYTALLRRGETVLLAEDRIRCPWCGGESPAYAHCHGQEGKRPRVGRKTFERWMDPQYAIPGFLPDIYPLNNLWTPGEEYLCPLCGQISGPAARSRKVHVRARRGRAEITWDAVGLRRILRSRGLLPGGQLTIKPPLTETVSFNLKKGRVALRITDAEENLLVIRDITDGNNAWEMSSVCRLITASDRVRQELALAFREASGEDLPFEEKELTPELLAAVTRFAGYPRDFYDAIPYDLESGRIERSFRGISRRLHSADALPGLYSDSGLPGMKSVKRIFFTRPGLFFYLEEARMLWEAVEDPNFFCTLLSMPRIYDVMSFLHRFPDGIRFFRDYRRERGGRGLCRTLEDRWESLPLYIGQYCIMSPASRAEEWRKWRRNEGLAPDPIGFSIPMPGGDREIRDCTVDGYCFFWLRSRVDYQTAGKAMNNCLVSWKPNGNPVVAVKKDGRFVAAVELLGKCIVQVRAAENEPIEAHPALNRAFQNWRERYGLDWLPFMGLEDDEDELPF